MCASYFYHPDAEQLKKFYPHLKFDISLGGIPQSEAVFPFKDSFVLKSRKDELHLTRMRYSLTPMWSKEAKVKWATYNARMNRINEKTKKKELIYEVPTWKGSFGKKNCAVPVHSFFESCHEGLGAGHIVEFTPNTEELLFAAGIFDEWTDKNTGEVLESFAIVTGEPSEFVQSVGHDRLPIFLNSSDAETWVKGFKSGKEAYEFLDRCKIEPSLEFKKSRPLKSRAKTAVPN